MVAARGCARSSVLPLLSNREVIVRHRRIIAAVVTVVCAAVGAASVGASESVAAWPSCAAEPAHASPWAVSFASADEASAAGQQAVSAGAAALPIRFAYTLDADQATRRPVPVEYSDGYKVRAKIHKIASIATLPLFIATYAVGQNIYNHPGESESQRGVHAGLGAATGVLFGVNTVTGVWNLVEGRKDPNHRTRRMTHGILMIAADVGFLATALTIPDREGDYQSYIDGRSTHRTMALTSMGIATVGYLMMLFTRN
jgi:hypothetical protein